MGYSAAGLHFKAGPEGRFIRAGVLRGIAVGLTLIGVLAQGTLFAHDAQARRTSPETAVVALGDSFISGEAGRWKGNSNSSGGDLSGTDRAWSMTEAGWAADPSSIYIDNSYYNGCHRSDVAPLRSARLPVTRSLSFACSGARVDNLLRAQRGGSSLKGEDPQNDQLKVASRNYNVKLIAISIGANDLGFASMIKSCMLTWFSDGDRYPCNPGWTESIKNSMPGVMSGVGSVIDDVRAVMSESGYRRSDYRIVLFSYASPLPKASETRYPSWGYSRLTTGGCPFANDDLDWEHSWGIPTINSNLQAVAASRGAEFLDLEDTLRGHEICAKGVRLANASNPPSPATSEWVRFLTTGLFQGNLLESFHPNYYAQQVFGGCISELYERPGTSGFRCQTDLTETSLSGHIEPLS